MDDSAHERPTSAAAAALLGQMKRAVFDGSRIAVIQRDLANRVLYANAAALDMSGAGHVDELRLDQLFAGEAGRILDEETRGRRNGELGAYRVTLTRLDDPGRQVAVEVTGLPLMDARGAVVGSLGFFRSLQHQVLTDRLRELTLSHAGRPDLLPRMAEALRSELPYDLMLVSRVVADGEHWESEIVFNHPPFRQDVPTAWYELNDAQRAFMEANDGGIHDFDAVMSAPPWSDMADEPICRQMRAMELKSSMWRRITRGQGADERTVAILTLLSRERDAYGESHQTLFNQLPLVETVLCALDHAAQERDRRQLRMFRALNRCVDIQGACRCLADALIEIFDWQHVALFRIDSARESIVRVASARRGDDGCAVDTGTVWGDYAQHLGVGILGRVARTMTAQKIPDVSQDPDYLRTPNGEPIRSELAVPILFSEGERVRFIVNVDDPRVNAFSREHVRQLTDIAHEVAGAMERISDLTLMTECVNNVADPVIATDAKLRIRRVNPAAEALFGARRKALEGRSLIDLFQDPQPLVALLQGTEAGDRIGELHVRRPACEDVAAEGPEGSEVPGGIGEAPSSVFVTRRDFPGKLGGHVFIARDLRPIRRSVQLEFLEETAYELAVETQAPLGMAMSWLESELESAHRPGAARDPDRARDLQTVLRQLGRVKHAFTRLAMYNREARVAARAVSTVQLDSELEALLASLAASEREKVRLVLAARRVEVEADHTQMHIVVESLLSVLLRAAPETATVQLTLVPDDREVFLRLRGKLPPARRHGTRFAAPEAAQADLRLAHPLLDKLMRNQGGSLRIHALADGETEFVLGFPRGIAHG
ncbi:PAS domain-containing protein [Mitsuaria sp. BK045]|uniref:PAS domain-containing protein n=1 Tax=unclassified Roseateles TaxID=2626991 RepID=UPI00161B936D|nr:MULTISPECIES: PAS domain-containing protein [unclassified Roseateles]MBB3295454.1 PAS domain-containing protein [Mitsuaria sp. BK041]MBB3364670.1 PAS domain-containing protein [Mitsuaria sp. BK045]